MLLYGMVISRICRSLMNDGAIHLPGLSYSAVSRCSNAVYIGLGRRYEYLVAPVALWDIVDGLYSHVEKVIFEGSGHQPMLEEPQALGKLQQKDGQIRNSPQAKIRGLFLIIRPLSSHA